MEGKGEKPSVERNQILALPSAAHRVVACDVMVPIKRAWLRVIGGQPK